MSAASIVDVILFTRQAELTKIATEHLKMKGISNILTVTEAQACSEALKRLPKGLLLIDWQVGPAEVALVLGQNRKTASGPMRPIMLVADKVTNQIIATAAEYAVSQIFTEEITKRNLGGRLSNMLLAETLADEIKKALGEVQKARLDGDLKKGSKILVKLLPKHPNNLRLKTEAAELMMEMGELDSALTILTGMDKANPPYLRGVHLLGRCLMKLGRFDDGLKALEQANLFNPHDVDRLVDIGQALLEMDRFKDAAGSFDQALANDPERRDARVGKAQCKLMDNQVNEALAVLKDVTTDLEMASIFNTCAVMNMRKKRHSAGMNLYESALRVLGKNPKLQARLYFNMGLGYRRWGKKTRAIESLQACARLDPNFKKASLAIAAIKDVKTELPSPFGQEIMESATPTGGSKKGSKGLDKPEPLSILESEGSFGLEDFTSNLDSLLDDNLEESLFNGKKPA
ncbi:MAG: tetratricopeptide repeat protein [Proteobacteria bacterium]|nr:tetratricopeptide repeat protein [Pseudomonadota bacterium]